MRQVHAEVTAEWMYIGDGAEVLYSSVQLYIDEGAEVVSKHSLRVFKE